MNKQTSPQPRISTNLEQMFASAKRRNLNNTGIVVDFAQNIWDGNEVWHSSQPEFSLYVEHDDTDSIRIMESGNIAEMKVINTYNFAPSTAKVTVMSNLKITKHDKRSLPGSR